MASFGWRTNLNYTHAHLPTPRPNTCALMHTHTHTTSLTEQLDELLESLVAQQAAAEKEIQSVEEDTKA